MPDVAERNRLCGSAFLIAEDSDPKLVGKALRKHYEIEAHNNAIRGVARTGVKPFGFNLQ